VTYFCAGVIKAAPWGLMFRVLTGAIMSLVDLSTDLYVANMYRVEERYSYFRLVVGMVSCSMLLQVRGGSYVMWILRWSIKGH
jgi:hypothetical protein